MKDSGNISVEMYGIVLGANDSILEVELPYGYELSHQKLIGSSLENNIFSRNNKVDIKYCASNLGSEEDPEFIFIHKKTNNEISVDYFTIDKMITGNEEITEEFEKIKKQWNYEIFNILSMLRLTQEGNIEISDKKFSFIAKYRVNEVSRNIISSLDRPISVYNDFYEWKNNENTFNMLKNLPETMLEVFMDVFSRFGSGYSTTGIEDAYKNLVSLAEIILIGYNSDDKHCGKKEKFSNRIVAAISDDESARAHKMKLMQIYKVRSDETHEGNSENISLEELKILREYIRKVVLDFIGFCNNEYSNFLDKSFKGMKKEYILKLLSRISYLKDNNFLDC